jgi:predicted ATPase/DNA-binding SARP family transcriptional activator
MHWFSFRAVSPFVSRTHCRKVAVGRPFAVVDTLGAVDYAILGPLEVRDTGTVRPIPGIKERALLGLLVVEAGTVVSVDRMIYELWGDEPPPTAVRTVRSYISRLRRALERDGLLRTRRPGYLLAASPVEIDAARFETLADQARRALGSNPAEAARVAGEGLDLWRGPPLDDLSGFVFAETEARRLTERRLATTEIRIEASLRLGHHDRVIPEITAVVQEHPFRERLWAQLMLALHRAGRTGDALRAFGDAARALGETLGIEPSIELRSLERAIVMDDPSLRLGSGLARHNLPAAPSSFIGRDKELDALADALTRSRLVTLTGPGGCGKSRLAIEVAGRVLGNFPDGVWRTELAALTDPEAVPVAVSASLGEPASHAADPTESLTRFLRDRELLLVLDNCEHLLDVSAELVTRLLDHCPGLRVLTTSREPLRVSGETVWIVPPLQLPDAENPPDQQEASEAFRLFVERSTDAQPNFTVTDTDGPAITTICGSLAGLPLAIELAAARSRVLSPVELASRLASGLDALGEHRAGPARHRTMRAAVGWSVQSLDADRRRDFVSLAVFQGGWTLDDAAAVLPHTDDVPTAISDLVERSLVQAERSSGVTRYRLLEPIRQFGVESLVTREDEAALRNRHAARYLTVAEEADDGLRGPDQMAWRERLEAEHDNIRAALRWAIDNGDQATALRLVAAMGWFWFMAGHWRDAWRWLDESLTASDDSHLAERIVAIARTGGVQIIRRNDEPVLPMLEPALAAARHLGDTLTEAWCLHLMAHNQLDQPSDETLAMLLEARRLFGDAGRTWEVAWSDRYIGDAHAGLGDPELGVDTQLASIDTFRALGDRWSTAYGFHNLAFALLVDRGPAAARPYYERCRRLAEEISDPVWTAHGILGMAICDFLTDSGDAATLLADAEDRLRLIGDDNCLVNAAGYLGRVHERGGDDAAAATYYLEAVRTAHRIHKRQGIAVNFDRIAGLAARQGSVSAARRLLGAVEYAVSSGDVALHPLSAGEHAALVEELGFEPGDALELEELIPFAAGIVEDVTLATGRPR